MRKILTVALLSFAIAAPAFAADLTPSANPAPASASAAVKTEKKAEIKHGHKTQKHAHKTM